MKSQEKLPRAMADYGKRFEQGLDCFIVGI